MQNCEKKVQRKKWKELWKKKLQPVGFRHKKIASKIKILKKWCKLKDRPKKKKKWT